MSTDLKNYTFTFDELQIKAGEIEELMGFGPGESPEPFPGLIEEGLKTAPHHTKIEGGFVIYDQVEVDREKKSIRIQNQVFSPGKIVVTQLKHATSAALFACTAGGQISNFAQKQAALGNDLLAYVLDVIGSLIADKTVEKLQKKVAALVSEAEMGITDSFSPGYCNWSVAEQQKLFSLLPENFCGIGLSPSSLMHPIKSVSGIIGIGTNCKQKGYQCEWCNDMNCIYGRIRRQKKR
ncbi:MAG: vitamin B12 dependent-methionine synthase activation domain-containing protein [Tangfeifania sp.]